MESPYVTSFFVREWQLELWTRKKTPKCFYHIFYSNQPNSDEIL